MPENPRGVVPFNWSGLVAEAIRRRKAEKFTQREHAALASVSVPTIVAFDRGETTLTLAKRSISFAWSVLSPSPTRAARKKLLSMMLSRGGGN